jgi:sugar lactone lactonase YvrE
VGAAEVLMEGVVFGESPRWHDGRLWFSDWGANQVIALGIDIARRLLHDDQLKPEDQLAGLLVLLYAQGTTAISRMTVSQIQVHETGVRLRFGRAPIQLPEPVATLTRTVAANRKGHATIGGLTPEPLRPLRQKARAGHQAAPQNARRT